MAAAFITLWAGVGILVGAALAPCVRRLLTAVLPASRAVHLTVAPLTALAFGALAWRFGHQFDLLPYSVLAALGVALGVIDVLEQRLPSVHTSFKHVPMQKA